MNKIIIATLCMGLGSAVTTPVQAVGCLSGAAVGGAAGHVAGRHGFLGAAIGCAVGHHKAVMDRRARDRARMAPQQTATPARQVTPTAQTGQIAR